MRQCDSNIAMYTLFDAAYVVHCPTYFIYPCEIIIGNINLHVDSAFVHVRNESAKNN
jgi:hypothetical protein